MDALANAEAFALLRDALQDQFDVGISEGKGKNQGKLILKKKQSHGGSNDHTTLVALEMGRRRALKGESLVDDRVRASTEPLRKAFDLLATGQSITELGKAGLRGGADVTPELMKERAWNMLLAYDRGYNPETGAPYGDVGTDGGHKKPHHLYPELSTAAGNIMPENKYENRIKGAIEGEDEVAEVFLNNILNKVRKDPTNYEYSDAAKAEMAAGPPIMSMNRKQFLKARRQGLV